MSTALRSTPMKPWGAAETDTAVEVDLRVELIGRKGKFVLWAGFLSGDNVPADLVGKLVSYAPSPTDGFLAATVGNEPPFILRVALLRVVGVER